MRDNLYLGSNDNSLFVTAQCDNRCLMCSQPPLNINDIDSLYAKNIRILESAPVELKEIGITGGEPTLLGEKLFTLIEEINNKLPNIEIIHILSNGKAFADRGFTKELKHVGGNKLLLGIPLHSDYEHDHNYIAQSDNAYSTTIKGLYNLAENEINIELRVVINGINAPRLGKMSSFIYKNLPFTSYTSFMGLEDTGYAIKNRDLIWVDPAVYRKELEKGVLNLATWCMDVAVFNLPYCCLPETLYEFACKSISDWKVSYPNLCDTCDMKSECCGLFSTSRSKYNIRPIRICD